MGLRRRRPGASITLYGSPALCHVEVQAASAGPAVAAALDHGASSLRVEALSRSVVIELPTISGELLCGWLEGVGIQVLGVRECLPRGGVKSPRPRP